jgi:hypothetical protein
MTSWSNATRATQRGEITYAQEEERLRREEEEKQQAEAARQQQQSPQNQTFNPLEGVGQALENVRDTIVGLGDATVGRERVESLQQSFEEAAYSNPAATTTVEALRAVGAAPVRLLEGVLDTGALVTDTALSPLRRGSERDPFSDRYVRAKFDLGIQGTKTPIGKMAEGIVTFAVGMKLIAAKLPIALVNLGTKGQGIKGAIASGLVPGAAADFLLADPSDGNLSTLIKEVIPEEYRETFLLALAVDDDDNPWEAKIKAILEGASIGAVTDAVGWMLIGRRAAQRALRSGATKDQAAKQGLEAAAAAQKGADTKYNKDVNAENKRWTEAQQKEMSTLLDRERRLTDEEAALRASGIEDGDPRLDNLRLEMDETKMTMAQLDNEIVRGFDPDSRTLAPHERSATLSKGSVDKAVVEQMRAENGVIPRAAQSGNLPPGARVNMPSLGSSAPVMTDAGIRLLNLDKGAEQVLRDTMKDVGLQRMARSLGKTDEEVVSGAAQLIARFNESLSSWDAPGADVRQLMREIGSLDTASGVRSGEVLSAEGIVAMRAIIGDTSNQIFNLATNAAELSKVMAAGGNQFDRIVDRLTGLLEIQKESLYYFGSHLRAGGLTVDGMFAGASRSVDDTALTMNKARQWAEKIKDLARKGDPSAKDEMDRLVEAMVLAGGDPTKTVTFADQFVRLGGKGAMDGMYNSILSGPATQLRNFFGNSYALFERPTSVALSGLMKGDKDMVRAAGAGFHAVLNSVSEAWQVAARSFKTGESINQNAKFVIQDATYKAQLKQMRMVADASGDANKVRAVGFLEMQANMMDNPFFSWPNRTLTAADDFFKTLNARQHMATDSMYKALSQAQSANDVDGLYNGYMTAFSKGIDPTTGRIVDPNLLDYAERATFQNDPGSVVNSLTNFLNQFPAGRVFVPFVRTPANLMSYVQQHTPGLARFASSYKDAIKSGDAIKIAEYQGREAVGGMFVSLAMIGAASGNITGTGPADPRERRIWEQTHEPKSIKIGGKWVSYRGVEPLETILSIAADTVGVAAMGGIDSAEKLAGQLTYAIAAGIVEKSYMAGLAELSNVINPSNWTADGAARGILGTANSFIPYSAARRALSQSIDPYLKEVNSELERTLNTALPTYKVAGTTKIDWLTGEEMTASGGGLYNAVSPLRIVDKGQDPVKDMLVDINFEMGDNLKLGPAGVSLDADRRARLAREIHATGVYGKLDRLRKQKWFKQSVEDWRGKGFRWSAEGNRPRHYTAVEQIINQSRTAALKRMQIEDPGFAEMIRAARKTSVQYRRGVYEQVEQLSNFPN